VHACYRATGLPIVGTGGVETGRHALELLAAGAAHVALGTVLFGDPDAPARVREELAAELAARGLDDPAEAVGLAHGVVHRGVEDVEKPLLIGRNRSN
jgi:dihydroorotate dehydrogenase (NAD+) catalytic subunit